MATVHHFLYMRFSETGLLISKWKPSSEGNGVSHVALTEKALAQCLECFSCNMSDSKKLQTCLDLCLESSEIVLSGNKDIKQVCLICREAESRWVLDLRFASLAHTEKPGNQPQQLSDNDNFIVGLHKKPEGNSKPTQHLQSSGVL